MYDNTYKFNKYIFKNNTHESSINYTNNKYNLQLLTIISYLQTEKPNLLVLSSFI